MPGRVEDHVRLVSVKLRAGEASHRIKRKVLRSLRNAEKKEHKSAYPPTEQSYSIPDLPSRDVVKVVSNSRFVAFLLQDGRVCRIQCSSYAGSSKEFVEGKWLGAGKEPSFQVFSDAEYARQLQAQFDAESVRGRGQHGLMMNDTSYGGGGEGGRGRREEEGGMAPVHLHSSIPVNELDDWPTLRDVPMSPVRLGSAQRTSGLSEGVAVLPTYSFNDVPVMSPPPAYESLYSRVGSVLR